MKRLMILILATAILLSLAACGNGEGSAVLRLDTAGKSGTYYSFGNVLADAVREKTGTNITVLESSGARANIEELEAHRVQLAFSQSDVAAYAYEGTRLFEDSGQVENFSTVAALYMEQVQIVTLNPDIKTVADLTGRNVSVGAPGSGTYFNAVDVLGAYGIDTKEGINPTYQDFTDSVEALRDGKIDAAFVVAGAPAKAVVELSESDQVYIVELDDAHIAKLKEGSPYYSENVIPADVYHTPEDVVTVAVAAVLLARDDVSETDVYNLISTIYDNVGEIKEAHPKGAELDLDFAASYTSVPYHPGAAKYFARYGIKVMKK